MRIINYDQGFIVSAHLFQTAGRRRQPGKTGGNLGRIQPGIYQHGGYSKQKAAALKALTIDAGAVARIGLRYERLDQLLVEHLLGVRG